MTGFGRAEAVAYLLGRECGACGTALPAPGEPCGACGWIPEMTAPELTEDLAGPRALAAVEAAKLRAEAGELRGRMLVKYMDADRVLHMARLEERRALAQAALADGLEGQAKLEAPLKAARKKEERAARELTSAAEDHARIQHAEELARRMRHGLEAETAAALRLAAAGEVLQRYQAALTEAVGRRQAAENALTAARERVGQLERIRDEAVADVENPGRIPRSAETVTADPVRLLLTGQLDEAETLMAQIPARFLAAMTGLTEDIEAQARQRLKDEQERERRDKPLHLQALGNGAVSATANPLHAGNLQPFHPPGPDAALQRGTIPLLGGFG